MGLQTSTALNANITSLLKTLTKTMEEQGKDISEISVVQKQVLQQFGIQLPDDFTECREGSFESFIGEIDWGHRNEVSRTELYERYIKFCRDERTPINSKNWFYKRMRQVDGVGEKKTCGFYYFFSKYKLSIKPEHVFSKEEISLIIDYVSDKSKGRVCAAEIWDKALKRTDERKRCESNNIIEIVKSTGEWERCPTKLRFSEYGPQQALIRIGE